MAPKRKAEDDGDAAGKKRKGAGGGAVDGSVPGAGGKKVVEDYTVTLNQTHIDANNNKFYIIQVLEGGGKYYSWNRWGRVGEGGQNKLLPCATKEKAIKEFESKFRSKTQNSWANRASFKPVNGKYNIVDVDKSSGGGRSGGDKAPIGKLTEAQIAKGRKVLDKLKAALAGKPSKAAVEALSSEFYTLIPQDFGRKRPPLINSLQLLEAQAELLKFFLRMGFDKHDAKSTLSPISGLMGLAVPENLPAACAGITDKHSIKDSDDAGKKLASKQAGKPKKKMDAHLYGAILLYTSNAVYHALNQVLRDKDRGKVKKYFKYLRLLFEAMGNLSQQKKTLWRGLSVDLDQNPEYKVGNTVVWWGVSSCTSDQKVASGFAGGCGGGASVVTIEAKTACDIAAISFYGNEKESLLCPGTKLKVKRKEKKGGITHVTLEEVGRAID